MKKVIGCREGTIYDTDAKSTYKGECEAMKRINNWHVYMKRLCVMLIALIGIGSVFSCRCASATSLPDEFIKSKVFVNRPNSTLRMYIPLGEIGCVMGQDQTTHQDWFALITERGEIKWQITNAMPEYYCGAMERDGMIYILVSSLGIPLAERTPYLLPLTLDGIKQTPVFLPSWIADAIMMKASDALLFFSRSTSPLTVAKYDDQLAQIWEKEITGFENKVDFFFDAIETSEGYALLGASRYGQDAVIATLDTDGYPLWTKTCKDMGCVSSAVTSHGELIVLCEQTGDDDEATQYSLLVLDSKGALIHEQRLGISDENLEFRSILLLPNGFLLCGARQYSDKAPETALLFLDDTYRALTIVDVPAIKDTLCQAALMSNDRLAILGIGTGDAGQANGYVVGDMIELDALCHWLTFVANSSQGCISQFHY
ncbi:MAG: hypothetical protein RSE38_12295 [Acinetobacter sp.]